LHNIYELKELSVLVFRPQSSALIITEWFQRNEEEVKENTALAQGGYVADERQL